MIDISKAGTFALGDREREASRLRRDAARRTRRVRTAEGSRRGDRGVARGGGERRRSHRHQRLLRPARHQPDHPRGAPSLSARPVDRHQARRACAATTASWLRPSRRRNSTSAVHDNLRNLGVEALDVVNLRIMGEIHAPGEGSIEAPFTVLAGLQRQGLIRHLGISNVTRRPDQGARAIAEIVCVQNHYNVAHRDDDALIDELGGGGHRLCPVLPARRLHAAAVDAR